MIRKILSTVLALILPSIAMCETMTIPFGTTVFCELDEQVTSRKKETSEGDLVRAHVWKDVWVDGELVIKAGTAVFTRVSEVKKAKIAGRKGKLELEALNVVAVDGRDIPLDGGYDKSGKGKMGLSIALAAVVAWPLIFLKGKQAILEPGTIFDAMVRSPVDVEVENAANIPTLRIPPPLVVEVLYDEMDPDSKIQNLPLQFELAEGTVSEASIVAVNGQSIAELPIVLEDGGGEGSARGAVEFKPLSKHFSPGMNRFDVRVGDLTAEVLLEIEF